MIGINDINGIKITNPKINFGKAIDADYYENLEFPDKYPAFITLHEEKPAVSVPLHWHNGGELIYSRNWNLEIIVNGEQQMLRPGEFILISPYALHAVIPEQRKEKMEVMSLTLDVESLAKINANVQCCEISRYAPGTTDQMRKDMVALCEKLYEQAEKEDESNDFLMNSILFEVIGNIMEHFWVRDTAGPRKVSAREHRLKSILAYISENYKENLSTHSVAEHFGYNREYFCRIFKKYSNMTFKEYLTRVRLDAVLREMRRSEESCAQIALNQGFPDVKGFNSAFKSRYGMSPNQYRKVLMMFDPKPIMEERKLLDPIPTPVPAEFPHTDEVPEGCTVLTGLKDDWGYYVDFHTDVIYAERDGRELRMHILEPKVHFGAPEEQEQAPHKWPCIAYIQGSAFHKQWLWNNISRHIRVAEHGYIVAIIEYRPSEVAPFPAQMQDAKTAIRYLRKHADEYNIDADHMAVCGDSSGGHTSLMVGFTGDDAPDTDLYNDYSAKVNCIIDVYGPTVFSLMNYYESSQNHYDPDSPEGFEIGRKNVLENPELANATIPMNYLSEDKPPPPLLVIHGGRDMLVPFNQSCQLYNYMKKMGKEVTFYKIDEANHGCLGYDNDTILRIVLDFLKEHI